MRSLVPSRLEWLALLVLASGCGTGATVQIQTTARPRLAPEVGSCMDAAHPTQTRCWSPLLGALEAGERGLAGELLLAVGSANPDVGRAATWLNPTPWTRKGRAGVDVLDGTSVPAAPVRPGSRVIFGPNADGDESTGLVAIALAVPVGEGWLAGDGLTQVLGAAVGASAAAWQLPDGTRRIVPAAPLFARLLGGALPPAPDWATAEKLGKADAALRAGDHVQAFSTVDEVLRGGQESPSRLGCALSYLAWQIARKSLTIEGSEHRDRLSTLCAGDQVTEGGFLIELAFFEQHLDNIRDRAKVPREWLDPGSVSRYAARVRKIAAGEQPVRAALLKGAAAQVVATTGQPADRCDDEQPEAQRKALRRITRQLARLGRTDLGWYARADRLVPMSGDTDGPAMRAYGKWLAEPANAWLATWDADASVYWIGSTREEFDRAELTGLCADLFVRMTADAKRDTHAGFEERAMNRVSTGILRFESCRAQGQALGKLTNEALDRALNVGPSRDALLRAIWRLTLGLTMFFVEQRQERLQVAIPLYYNALLTLEPKLGKTAPADRVAGQLIRSLREVIVLLRGGQHDLARVLGKAATTFADVAKTNKTTKAGPWAVRLAPGFHVGIRALRAIAMAISGQGSAAGKALRELSTDARPHVDQLLKNLGAPPHGATISALLAGLSQVLSAALKGTPESRASAAKALGAMALKPGKGWWSVGITGGELALWETLLVVAELAGDRANADGAVARAEVLTTRLVRRTLSELGLEGTAYELLALLAPLHKGVITALRTKGGDGGKTGAQQRWSKILGAFDAPLAATLKRIKAPTSKGPRSFVGMLGDLLRAASRAGLARLADPAKAQGLIGQLQAVAGRYDGSLRAYVEAVLGATATLVGSDGAAYFERAAKYAGTGALLGQTYVASLLQAKLALSSQRGGTFVERARMALEALDQAMQHGEASKRCKRYHPVAGLHIPRMWLRAVTGDFAGARADYEAYLSLVGVGGISVRPSRAAWWPPYSGQSKLRCWLTTRQGNFVGSVDISTPLRSVFIGGTQEGAFQLGAGASSLEESTLDERLACDTSTGTGRRADKIMAAHLAFAVYAFLSTDEVSAHHALIGAMREGRLIAHGADSAVMGRVGGASLMESVRRTYLPLIIWATVLAERHGQLQTAFLLRRFIRGIAERQKLNTDEVLAEDMAWDPESPLPGYLRHLDRLAPLAPVVTASANPKNKVETEKLLSAHKKVKGLGHGWALPVLSSWHAARLGSMAESLTLAKRLKPPKKGIGAAIVAAWKVQAASSAAGPLPSREDAMAALKGLLKTGLWGEAGGFAMIMTDHFRKDRKQDALALLELAASKIPAKVAPLLHSDVQSRRAELLAPTHPKEAAKLAAASIEARHGRIAAKVELEARLNIINLLGRTDQRKELTTLILSSMPLFRRAAAAHPIRWNLEAITVALGGLQGHPDRTRIRRLLERWPKQPDTATAGHFLKLLKQNATHALNASTLCEQFLAHIFRRGPAPKAP